MNSNDVIAEQAKAVRDLFLSKGMTPEQYDEMLAKFFPPLEQPTQQPAQGK